MIKCVAELKEKHIVSLQQNVFLYRKRNTVLVDKMLKDKKLLPNLKFNPFAIHFYGSDLEINT